MPKGLENISVQVASFDNNAGCKSCGGGESGGDKAAATKYQQKNIKNFFYGCQ